MPRRLFMILSALSLILCVATCVLWVRSYFVIDHVMRGPGNCVEALESSRGGVLLGRAVIVPPPATPMFRTYGLAYFPERPAIDLADHLPTAGIVCDHGVANFRFVVSDFTLSVNPTYRSRTRLALIPLWFPALLAGLLPAHWLRRFFARRSRLQHNHCSACGYDLRATPARCPECGTVAADGISS